MTPEGFTRYVPSDEIDAPDSLNSSEPICIGKTFSGGRTGGICELDPDRPPLELRFGCEATADVRGVVPEVPDCLFLRLFALAVLPVLDWRPGARSELAEPSRAEGGLGLDIRSKETERAGGEGRSGPRCCFSLPCSTELPTSCSRLRFKADLGRGGWTKTGSKGVALLVSGTLGDRDKWPFVPPEGMLMDDLIDVGLSNSWNAAVSSSASSPTGSYSGCGSKSR